MRRPIVHYRDQPRFMLRRLERIAGDVNTFLFVIALGLGMLDLLYAAQKIVAAIPPVVQTTTSALKP